MINDKTEFIATLEPVAYGFEGDFDWNAIADDAGEYDADRGWHLRESIAVDVDDIGFSDEFNEILAKHDLTNPENQPEIRCILLEKGEERSLYHVHWNIDGDNYETVAVCVYDGNPNDPDIPWDWEDKPETLEDVDHIEWTSCEYSLADSDLPIEARAVIHAIIEQFGM